MNILQVNAAQSNSGGGEVFLQKLSNELSLNHKVSVLTFQSQQVYALINKDIKKVELGVWRKSFDHRIPKVAELKLIRKTIRENELLHIHTPFWLLSIIIFFINFKRKKTVCTVHGKMEVIDSGFQNTINKIRVIVTFHIVYFLCDRFVFLNNYDLQHFRRRVLFPLAKKSVVIGSGCDTSFFSSKKKEQISNNIFTVLYVGQLSKTKGVPDLLKVARQLKQENILFKFVGEEANPKDRQLKDDLSKEKNILLCGRLTHDELKIEYDHCDVLVLPSYSETFGMVLVEAMSMGKPVIATRISGIPDIIEDKINGLLFETGDVTAFKEAIIFLKSHPEIRLEMNKRNKKLARKKYDWKTVAQAYETLFKRMMTQR